MLLVRRRRARPADPARVQTNRGRHGRQRPRGTAPLRPRAPPAGPRKAGTPPHTGDHAAARQDDRGHRAGGGGNGKNKWWERERDEGGGVCEQ